MTEALSSNYWISPTALYITLNALGKPDYIQANCVSGAVIMCHMSDIPGLTYDNGHNFRRWRLSASPTVFNTSSEKYVYVQIPRDTTKDSAMVVFPSEHIDIYGCNEAGTQIGSTDYYYIWLQGKISEVNSSNQREWVSLCVYGTLSTDEAINNPQSEWYSYDTASQVVTFLKNMMIAAGHKFYDFFTNTLKVYKTSELDGKVTIGGNDLAEGESALNVEKGGADIKGDVSMDGDTKITGDANVNGDATIGGRGKIVGAVTLGDNLASDNFVEGAPLAGSGWQIDHDGNIEGESIKVRGFMEVPEIRFNRASIVAGTNIQSPCGGVIKSVEPMADDWGYATLELGDDDIAGSIAVNDLCWGYFHDISTKDNNADDDYDDHNGEINYKGFATVYFHIAEILNDNSTRFKYELRPDTNDDGSLKYGLHPYVGMHFGGRGNTTDEARQGFRMSTPNYTATYQMVSSWDMSGIGHIVKVEGLLDGFEALAGVTQGAWTNEYGTIDCNVYMRGIIQQVTDSDRMLYITEESNGIVEEGETEKVTIVIRDNWFQDRTSEFLVDVEHDGKKWDVHDKGSTKAIVLEYPYSSLSAEINRYTVTATGDRQVRVYDTEKKAFVYKTETVTLTDTFVIRKETPVTLLIKTNIDNDPFIDNIEPKHVICAVETNKGIDMTSEVSKWSIERGDYNDSGEWTQSDSDKVWGQRSKVTEFNGTIDLYWSSDVNVNDLDLTKEATKFRITATIGTEEIETTIKI